LSFFDQIYDRLFKGNKDSTPTLVHEVLTRSNQFVEDYDKWTNGPQLLEEIKRSYEFKQKGIEQNPAVHVLESQYANGFAVSYNDFFQEDDFGYLMDLLSERVQLLGYRLVGSDRIITDKNNFVETKEKHYLKPEISMEPPIDQRYGNVLVEHVLVNDKSSYLKFSANVYSDHLYKKALPFQDLLNEIL
jgi:hypothetical protein